MAPVDSISSVRVKVGSFKVVEGSSTSWLAFAQSQPEATLFHHPAWLSLLSTTYHYRPLVLTQTDQAGHIVAGLPMLVPALSTSLSGTSPQAY